MITNIDKSNCCGCSACVHICPRHCISFREDSEGFLYPTINIEQCADCGLCDKVCPSRSQESSHRPIIVYAAKNKNVEVRWLSSSGGIFSAIAEKIIENGGVVFGAKFDKSWNVVHSYTDKKEDLEAFRGSKYVQSDNKESFPIVKEFLMHNRQVLYSGTPCQVSGLLNYLGKEYNNLLTIDFACHGVGSPKIWREWINSEIGKLGIKQPSYMTFRFKKPSAKNFSFAIFADTTYVIKKSQNPYFSGYLNNLFIRPSCYKCPSKAQYKSDFTLADYWGLQYVHPYFEDKKGVSAVFVNTTKAHSFFLKSNIDYIESTYNNVTSNNPLFESSIKHGVLSYLFWEKYRKQGVASLNVFLAWANFVNFLFFPVELLLKVMRRVNRKIQILR